MSREIITLGLCRFSVICLMNIECRITRNIVISIFNDKCFKESNWDKYFIWSWRHEERKMKNPLAFIYAGMVLVSQQRTIIHWWAWNPSEPHILSRIEGLESFGNLTIKRCVPFSLRMFWNSSPDEKLQIDWWLKTFRLKETRFPSIE